jgi:hypothetical protein
LPQNLEDTQKPKKKNRRRVQSAFFINKREPSHHPNFDHHRRDDGVDAAATTTRSKEYHHITIAINQSSAYSTQSSSLFSFFLSFLSIVPSSFIHSFILVKHHESA